LTHTLDWLPLVFRCYRYHQSALERSFSMSHPPGERQTEFVLVLENKIVDSGYQLGSLVRIEPPGPERQKKEFDVFVIISLSIQLWSNILCRVSRTKKTSGSHSHGPRWAWLLIQVPTHTRFWSVRPRSKESLTVRSGQGRRQGSHSTWVTAPRLHTHGTVFVFVFVKPLSALSDFGN